MSLYSDFSYDAIATSVAGYAGEFAGEFDLDAIATEYRDALIEVLPEGVQLIGDDLRIDWETVGGDRDEVAARIYAAAESIDIGEIFQRHELPELTDADAAELAGQIAAEVDNAEVDGTTVTLWDRRVTVHPAEHEFRIEFQRMTDSMWGRWEDDRDDERFGRADADEATEAGAEFLRGVIEVHGEFYAVDRFDLSFDDGAQDELPCGEAFTPAVQTWIESGDEEERCEREGLAYAVVYDALLCWAKEKRDDIAPHVRLYTGAAALNSAQWNGNNVPDHREVAAEERERQEQALYDELFDGGSVTVTVDRDVDGELVATVE